jgi:hypothetical protein
MQLTLDATHTLFPSENVVANNHVGLVNSVFPSPSSIPTSQPGGMSSSASEPPLYMHMQADTPHLGRVLLSFGDNSQPSDSPNRVVLTCDVSVFALVPTPRAAKTSDVVWGEPTHKNAHRFDPTVSTVAPTTPFWQRRSKVSHVLHNSNQTLHGNQICQKNTTVAASVAKHTSEDHPSLNISHATAITTAAALHDQLSHLATHRSSNFIRNGSISFLPTVSVRAYHTTGSTIQTDLICANIITPSRQQADCTSGKGEPPELSSSVFQNHHRFAVNANGTSGILQLTCVALGWESKPASEQNIRATPTPGGVLSSAGFATDILYQTVWQVAVPSSPVLNNKSNSGKQQTLSAASPLPPFSTSFIPSALLLTSSRYSGPPDDAALCGSVGALLQCFSTQHICRSSQVAATILRTVCIRWVNQHA